MAEKEETVFRLEMDIKGAGRQLDRLQKARVPTPPGVAPPPVAAPARVPPRIQSEARRPVLTRLDRVRAANLRTGVTKPIEPVGTLTPKETKKAIGFARKTSSGALAITTAATGGAAGVAAGAVIAAAGILAAKSFALAANSQKIDFIAQVVLPTPFAKALDKVLEPAKRAADGVKGFTRTIGDVQSLAVAFGAIGQPPPLTETKDVVFGLFEANQAQAFFQRRIQEGLIRSGASTFTQAMRSEIMPIMMRTLGLSFGANPQTP